MDKQHELAARLYGAYFGYASQDEAMRDMVCIHNDRILWLRVAAEAARIAKEAVERYELPERLNVESVIAHEKQVRENAVKEARSKMAREILDECFPQHHGSDVGAIRSRIREKIDAETAPGKEYGK